MSNQNAALFIDTSAFIGLYLKDDDFHEQAINFLQKVREDNLSFVTSNFILGETYTFIRNRKGKKFAVDFAQFLAENSDIVKVFRIALVDEKMAWKYFENLPGRKLSFTDCTSFALMRRLGIKEAFSFDKHFRKTGFTLRP